MKKVADCHKLLTRPLLLLSAVSLEGKMNAFSSIMMLKLAQVEMVPVFVHNLYLYDLILGTVR